MLALTPHRPAILLTGFGPFPGVPVNATLLVALVSLALGLYMASREDGITLLSTLVNFGALTAFLVLHGFGSNKASHNCTIPCEFLTEWGYVAMRFDYRGCGESEGPKSHIICLEQVEDTKAAVSYMASRPDVDPERIALIGSSFGAAVAVYTGGVDKRVAAVVSSGGWGDGERKFRGQHPTPEAWARFTKMLKDAKAHRAKTGKS